MVKNKLIHDSVVVYPKGRIDLHTNPLLATDFNDIMKKYPDHHYIFNMKDVEYMSSSGLGLMITIRRKLEAKQKKFIICEINNAVHKIFEAVGMGDGFESYASENEALDTI